MLLGYVTRSHGDLVASSQSHEGTVIANKASVNGGHRQDSALSWFEAKVFSTPRRRLGAVRHGRRTHGYLVVSFQSHKSIVVANKAFVISGHFQGL